MKLKIYPRTANQECRNRRQVGGIRPLMAALLALILGLLAGTFGYHRWQSRPAAEPGVEESGPALSEGTRRLLNGLSAPVNLQFYSLLDSSLPAEFAAFSTRSARLLEQYQQAAPTRLKVETFAVRSDAAEATAARVGLRAFNRDRGEPCYLGLILVAGDRMEVLPLAPDWEAALEADITRALARVSAPKVAAVSAVEPDRVVVEEVKRALPNLANLSVAEGTRILREQTLAAFTAIGREMEAKLQLAEQRLTHAGTEVEKAAVIKEIQQLRAEQTERLKALTIRMQEQISALEQLKRP